MTANPARLALGALFGTLRLLRSALAAVVILALVALNVATILSPAVFAALGAAVAAASNLLPDSVRPLPASPDTVSVETDAEGTASIEADDAYSQSQADLEAERAKSRALAADLEAERIRTTTLTADLEEARLQITTLSTDLDALHRQRDEAVEAIDHLSSRILNRAARGAVRAPGVLVGSALPFAGTAVDLAGTALDLSDACEMAHDMTALRNEMGLTEPEDVGPICAAVDSLPTLDSLLDPPQVVPCSVVVEDLRDTGLELPAGTCTRPTRSGEVTEDTPEPVEPPPRALDSQ